MTKVERQKIRSARLCSIATHNPMPTRLAFFARNSNPIYLPGLPLSNNLSWAYFVFPIEGSEFASNTRRKKEVRVTANTIIWNYFTNSQTP